MLTINFVKTPNFTAVITKHENVKVDQFLTSNVMNDLDAGFFKNILAGGYAANEIKIWIDPKLDEFEREYIANAWRIVSE